MAVNLLFIFEKLSITMRSPYLLVIFFLCFFNSSFAQNRVNRFALSIANDNDVYLMQRSDRYYTNGVLINFLMKLGNDTSRSNLLEIDLEHRLYNGLKDLYNGHGYWDRPYAAVFSLKTGLNKFIDAKRILRLSVNLEQVGPRAQGEEIQSFIHDTFKMYEVIGWENQLPNRFGLDLGVKYEQEFLKSRKFGLSGAINSVVGLNNIYFKAELPLRFGRINDFNKSAFSQGSLNNEGRNDEFFVFYKPILTYQVKNSSIYKWNEVEGQLPDNKMRPWLFTNQLGVILSKGRSSFMVSVYSMTTELKRMKYSSHQYARLQYSIMF